MYIDQYWGGYIGGTDDSLTLSAYLAEKKKPEITLAEIFSDFGRDALFGDFRNTVPPLVYTNPDGWDMELHYAIDLVSDLAALLLECKVNGNVDLLEVDDILELDPSDSKIQITATPEEFLQINRILTDFAADPAAFDISEMVTEEDLKEMAAAFESLREELYE